MTQRVQQLRCFRRRRVVSAICEGAELKTLVQLQHLVVFSSKIGSSRFEEVSKLSAGTHCNRRRRGCHEKSDSLDFDSEWTGAKALLEVGHLDKKTT